MHFILVFNFVLGFSKLVTVLLAKLPIAVPQVLVSTAEWCLVLTRLLGLE